VVRRRGADLDAFYPFHDDCPSTFHKHPLKGACDGINPAYYPFQAWCDEVLPAPAPRPKPRGVGGFSSNYRTLQEISQGVRIPQVCGRSSLPALPGADPELGTVVSSCQTPAPHPVFAEGYAAASSEAQPRWLAASANASSAYPPRPLVEFNLVFRSRAVFRLGRPTGGPSRIPDCPRCRPSWSLGKSATTHGAGQPPRP